MPNIWNTEMHEFRYSKRKEICKMNYEYWNRIIVRRDHVQVTFQLSHCKGLPLDATNLKEEYFCDGRLDE